jgi:GT2 family glycosyltransferase
LVLDNGSSDDSTRAIAERFPTVEQIANGRNLGFAAGANLGIYHALNQGADFVFLANNDTLIAPDALDLLVEAAQELDAALVAPKILYAVPPARIWSVGGWRHKLSLEISGCRRGQPDEGLGAAPFEVDFVTACGMLLRRRCVIEIGLFDERFFMYYEDSDYCLRARRAGQRLIVVPQAKMWHRVAVSLGGCDSPGERYHMALSSTRFFKKHTRGWRWLLVAPYRGASALKTVIRLLATGRPASAQAYLRGLRDGLL